MPLSAKHCCLAVAIALSLAALPALAQSSATRHELSLPAQPLGDALIALGKTAHVNIAFEPASVAGLRAPVLQGNYTPGEALQQLLKGSGLSARQTADNSYAIETSPSPSAKAAGNAQAAAAKRPSNDAKMLDEVRVTATVQGFSATRMPTALKDIPQSVSVIDQQTLREQNANDLDKALKWATGITLTARDSASSFYYSRGFALSNFHIDGSAQLSTDANYAQLIRTDLSQYESIELLRGADALFGGVGAPGGSINLTRKRPLPENAVSITASAGSWDNYRVEADLSGKLSGDGRLLGRMVAVNESQHYFYKMAQRRMNKLYAVTEYDVSPHTQVRLGGTVERTPDYVSVSAGLPRYIDGRDAHLPRSTALTFPWAKNSVTRKEGFLQLEHAFNERWKLRAGVNRIEQKQDSQAIQSTSPVDPASRTLVSLSFMPSDFLYDSGPLALWQTTADVTLTGSFDWNGRKQEVVFGFDGSRSESKNDTTSSLLLGTPIDPYRFDPSSYPVQVWPDTMGLDSGNSRERGVFASIKLRPADGWAITAGARNSAVRRHYTIQSFFAGEASPYYAVSSNLATSGVVTPYLGVVYEINPAYSLYASYADTGEVAGTAITLNGKVLKPPRGANQELGLKAAWYEGRLNGSLALFDIDKTNVPLRDPRVRPGLRPNCCFISTTQRSKGIEAELSGMLTPGWTMSAGYTFNVNRSGDGTVLSTVTPRHLLKLWSNYRLPAPAQAWDIGGGITAQSRNYNKGMACTVFDPVEGCIGAMVPFRAEQGFYTVATLRVGYRVNEHWNLALNLDNLLDRRYYQTVGSVGRGNWYGAPRNWMLTLRGDF